MRSRNETNHIVREQKDELRVKILRNLFLDDFPFHCLMRFFLRFLQLFLLLFLCFHIVHRRRRGDSNENKCSSHSFVSSSSTHAEISNTNEHIHFNAHFQLSNEREIKIYQRSSCRCHHRNSSTKSTKC